MEKTMMLPAMYNVLSQEEMTYTEGGATMTQALLAALLPPCISCEVHYERTHDAIIIYLLFILT